MKPCLIIAETNWFLDGLVGVLAVTVAVVRDGIWRSCNCVKSFECFRV